MVQVAFNTQNVALLCTVETALWMARDIATAQGTPLRYWQRRSELLRDINNGAMNSFTN